LGDEWLRIDGLKLYLDGGMESAYLKAPFITDSSYHGLQNYTKEKLQALVTEANRLGWSVGTHAVGDAAVEMALDAYEAANAEKSIVGRRWSIEHPFMLVSDVNIERAKRLGVIASAQSWHVYRYGYPMVTQWGKERANVALPFKSWLEKNVSVAGGSDSAGDPTFPNIEFLLMWTEVTRNSEQSGKLAPQEAITREQAIRLHTQAPAYLTFDESLKGSIEPGKLADFIVLSDDILTVPEDKMKTLEVLATIVGGRQVYTKPGIQLRLSSESGK
jgi:predicted amidohydrolase YtcJ